MRKRTVRAVFICMLAAAGLWAPRGSLAAQTEAGPASRPGVDFRLELDIEYQYRVRTDDRLIESGIYKNGIDLTRAFFDRPPLARLLLQGETPKGLGVVAEIALRDQWTGDYFRNDNFPIIGVAGDPLRFENFFFTKAAVYYKSPSFQFIFGREKPDYNGILYGGLLPGTRLPYLDAVRASGQIGRMKVDWMVATIQAIKSWDGKDVNPNEGAPTNPYGFETDATSSVIIEGMNRLTWDLGRVRLGVTDHVMMARRNNSFLITDFIPVISRHQAAISQTNNSMVLDIAWEPLDGLRLAAQAGFDDINAEIFGVGDTGMPTVDAYVLGADYSTATALGPLGAQAEFGYTHWLWGNYDGQDILPNDQNPFLRFQYRYLSDSGGLLLPFTSPYGPGALWVKASGRQSVERLGVKFGLDFLYLLKNDEANLISTNVPYTGNPDKNSAEGAHNTYFISLALPLSWNFRSWEVSARPELAIVEGNPWFELWLGAAYRLRASRR